MGKTYSDDLRVKALGAFDCGMKKMTVHRAFGVARSTLDDWLHLREQHGHVTPAPRPARTGRGFFNAGVFEAFALRHGHKTLGHKTLGHKTLGRMRLMWQQEQGQLFSEKTFSSWMHKIGWTRKKSRGYMPSETKRSDGPSSRA